MAVHARCLRNYRQGEAVCYLCELKLLDPEPDDEPEEDDDGIATTGTEDTPGLLPQPIV